MEGVGGMGVFVSTGKGVDVVVGIEMLVEGGNSSIGAMGKLSALPQPISQMQHIISHCFLRFILSIMFL